MKNYKKPERFAPGWWLIPAALFGIAVWAVLIARVFLSFKGCAQ